MAAKVRLRVYVAPDGKCRLCQPGDRPERCEPVPNPPLNPWGQVDFAAPAFAIRRYKSFTLAVSPEAAERLADPETLRALIWEQWEHLYPGVPHPAVRLGVPP